MEQTSTQPETYKPSERVNLYDQVTNTIINQLEQGTVPWKCPWKSPSGGQWGIPTNPKTNRNYRGINIVLLWGATIEKQFDSCEWGSFKQWQEQKQSVRKGEKGTTIVYYDTFEKEEAGEVKKIPFLKASVVFNKCQLADYKAVTPDDVPVVTDREESPELDTFIRNTGVIIQTGPEACFIPSKDVICMPPKNSFISDELGTANEHYQSTLLHELTHWTGPEKRLNREFGKKFGDRKYAIEELTAEFGASFLCAEFGIATSDIANKAAYIDHWLQVLRENSRYVLTAASAASNAVDYLHDLQPKL